jgi:hypothetical protein
MSLLYRIHEIRLISAKQQIILSFVQFAATDNLLHACVTQCTQELHLMLSLCMEPPNRTQFTTYQTDA